MKLLSGLTFDDVLLVPQYSELASRAEADISTRLGNITLKVPIVSANMDTVTETTMAIAMGESGGLGILHRYASEEAIIKSCKDIIMMGYEAVPSVGVMPEDVKKAISYKEFTNSICLDVAHGDSKAVVAMILELKKEGYVNIIAGNVATGDGALRLYDVGANIIKVGVGPGSVCTTRIVTGHGVPQLTAIEDVYKRFSRLDNKAYIIADGGIRHSGDIVKALAAGADAVMIGGLLAGTNQSPNKGVYRGMASSEAQMDFKGKVGNGTAEGVSVKIQAKGSVYEIIHQLSGGIRSGLSYSGCKNIEELQKYAIFMTITANGLAESHPHALKK